MLWISGCWLSGRIGSADPVGGCVACSGSMSSSSWLGRARCGWLVVGSVGL